ncbi:MAG: ComF family protein [Mucilaginibacter polytrichastri]|nr:ComF family protein [Mucilaginibacter polytrichastri]
MCTKCLYDLPYSGFEHDPENPVARQFWGRVPIKHAISVFVFSKGGSVQKLLHALKYDHAQAAGVFLGRIAGKKIRDSGWFSTPDFIIPVPLHPKRLRQRGYNQSLLIAQGISEVLNVPVLENVLVRQSNTATQTKRSRFERFINMQDSFKVLSTAEISGKHLLLVDDILTTGATLEACIEILSTSFSSICTIAYTN